MPRLCARGSVALTPIYSFNPYPCKFNGINYKEQEDSNPKENIQVRRPSFRP